MKALLLTSILLSGQAVGLAQRVVGPLELGSGSAEPGEVVELPVYFSSPYPLCLFSVLVCYSGLDFLGYEI